MVYRFLRTLTGVIVAATALSSAVASAATWQKSAQWHLEKAKNDCVLSVRFIPQNVSDKSKYISIMIYYNRLLGENNWHQPVFIISSPQFQSLKISSAAWFEYKNQGHQNVYFNKERAGTILTSKTTWGDIMPLQKPELKSVKLTINDFRNFVELPMDGSNTIFGEFVSCAHSMGAP